MNFDEIIGRAIVVGIALLVVFPVLLAVAGFLWNSKLRPVRAAKGKATARFGNIWKRFIQFSFKEEPTVLASKVQNPLVQKLTSLKSIYLISVLIATVGYIVSGSAFCFIPLGILFLVAFGRANKVFNERYSLLRRMFDVANSAFHYDRGAEFDPWSYVNVKGWQNLTVPGEIVIRFPTKFRADSQESRESFERHFTGTITDDNIWVYDWKAPKGEVTVKPVKLLPTMVDYPGVGDTPWNIFKVGQGADGPIFYDVMQTPHVLLAGSTGSGKSVLQRNVVFHCIQHNDRMRFLGVDLKRVELSVFNKYKRTVIGIGTDLEQGLGVVKYAFDTMQERYKLMEELGVNNFIDLDDPPYAILLMIDEAFMFLGMSGSKTDEGKANDEMAGQASDLIGKILRLGRASGVFVLMATQRPDATVIKGEMKNNMDVRIAAGRMDSTPSSMVLDSGAATQLPGHIKGRGAIRFGGAVQQFQGYFAPQTWIDDWLLDHPENEPSTVEEGGHLHEAYLEHIAKKKAAAEAAMKQSKPQQESKKEKAADSKADKPKTLSTEKSKGLSFKDRLSFKPVNTNADEEETGSKEPEVSTSKLDTRKASTPVEAAPEAAEEQLEPSVEPTTTATPDIEDSADSTSEYSHLDAQLDLENLIMDTPEIKEWVDVNKSVSSQEPELKEQLTFQADELEEDPFGDDFKEEPVEEVDPNDSDNWEPVDFFGKTKKTTKKPATPKPVVKPVKEAEPAKVTEPATATAVLPPSVIQKPQPVKEELPAAKPILVEKPTAPVKPVRPISPFAPKHQAPSPFKPKTPAQNPFEL